MMTHCLLGPTEKTINVVLIKMQKISLKRMHLKMSPVLWQPFCLCLMRYAECMAVFTNIQSQISRNLYKCRSWIPSYWLSDEREQWAESLIRVTLVVENGNTYLTTRTWYKTNWNKNNYRNQLFDLADHVGIIQSNIDSCIWHMWRSV